MGRWGLQLQMPVSHALFFSMICFLSSGSSFIASNGNALTGAPAALAHFAWVFLRLQSDVSLAVAADRVNRKQFLRTVQVGCVRQLGPLIFQVFFLFLGCVPVSTSSMSRFSIRGGGMLMRPFLSQDDFLTSLRSS